MFKDMYRCDTVSGSLMNKQTQSLAIYNHTLRCQFVTISLTIRIQGELAQRRPAAGGSRLALLVRPGKQ